MKREERGINGGDSRKPKELELLYNAQLRNAWLLGGLPVPLQCGRLSRGERDGRLLWQACEGCCLCSLARSRQGSCEHSALGSGVPMSLTTYGTAFNLAVGP